MGSAGAVEIVHRRDLMSADDPATLRKQLIEEYEEQYASPYIAAERGFIDDVIDPADTRRILARSLELLRSKREDLPKRKHGNVPL
jgi:acetyl-CoA carboxylase carboxyltransferase component